MYNLRGGVRVKSKLYDKTERTSIKDKAYTQSLVSLELAFIQ